MLESQQNKDAVILGKQVQKKNTIYNSTTCDYVNREHQPKFLSLCVCERETSECSVYGVNFEIPKIYSHTSKCIQVNRFIMNTKKGEQTTHMQMYNTQSEQAKRTTAQKFENIVKN